MALCVVFNYAQWKKIIYLVTAFTIGHSITLALAALKIVIINRNIVEFLIPITIIITCIINFANKEDTENVNKNSKVRYLVALSFGLIHGLGFSSLLLSLLGREENIIIPLLAFNIGLEIGQVLIVIASVAIAYIFINYFKIKFREWILIVSGIISGVALKILETIWIF